jgi:hypothetical protein
MPRPHPTKELNDQVPEFVLGVNQRLRSLDAKEVGDATVVRVHRKDGKHIYDLVTYVWRNEMRLSFEEVRQYFDLTNLAPIHLDRTQNDPTFVKPEQRTLPPTVKGNIYSHPECIFTYCPNPDLCHGHDHGCIHVQNK